MCMLMRSSRFAMEVLNIRSGIKSSNVTMKVAGMNGGWKELYSYVYGIFIATALRGGSCPASNSNCGQLPRTAPFPAPSAIVQFAIRYRKLPRGMR